MINGKQLFEKLNKKGSDFLGVQSPILGGAMSWISTHQLVSAISNAGGFGVIGGGNMPVELFAEEIKKTQSLTKNPFGVNMITIAPNFSPQLDYACKIKAPFITFAGGLPPRDAYGKVKDAGSKLICFAPSLKAVDMHIRLGADAIIIEGHEAGGHIGPVATSVLAEQILPQVKDVPVFVAGGIGSGFLMAHYMLMGAAGIQLGTRFAASIESPAHKSFKEAFVKATAKDVQPCAKFDPRVPVIPVRAIMNDGFKEFTALQLELIKKLEAGEVTTREAGLKLEEFWIGSLRRAVVDGDVKAGSLMAGQSVDFVKEIISVKAIIEEVKSEAIKEFDKVISYIG
ncbi:MAG: nitronate monooxygenase [Spirochaetia bacterium]|jgi:enoyl-[acyl-carrier protein] reductase II|nr:nitronate monooxygenase [Spirochaetia bacterium]